jgi:hypothetical protein
MRGAMSNYGHFNIPRSLTSDPLWKSLSYQYRHVFMTVMHHMAFKEIILDDFGVLTIVKPFQFLTTKAELTKLCDEEDIDESLVYRVILKLQKLGFWNHKTNHRKTLITIVREDILNTREPTFEPNSNQTRTKLEPQKNKDNKKDKEKKSNKPTPTPSVSEVAIFGCLVGLVLSDEEKVRLTSEFSEIDVKRAVCVLKEQKSPPSSTMGFLIVAIQKKFKPKNSKSLQVELSSRGKNNKETIERFKNTYLDQLKLKDILIYDMSDHVVFNNNKIFYESDRFGKEVYNVLEMVNLTHLVRKNSIPEAKLDGFLDELQKKMKANQLNEKGNL